MNRTPHRAVNRTRNRPVLRPALLSVTALGLTVGLAACSSGADSDAAGADHGRTLKVVTSTDVYADLVSQVVGDRAEVTPVIASAAQDPHSYEATAQDRLTVHDADLVVVNGGGYDAFMSDLVDSDTPTVDAVAVSGLQPDKASAGASSPEAADHEHGADAHDNHGHADHDHAEDDHDHGSHGHHHHHGGFNEHVWYDLEAMQKLTTDVAEQLGRIDHEHQQNYTERAHEVNEDLAGLLKSARDVRADGGYVATEPVPGYLLEDVGLHDDTPASFTEAIDADSDVPPAVFKQTQDLVTGGHVKLLAFNQQTSTGQTERLRSAARDAGVAVVEFSETLPDETTYQDWMRENINNVSRAVKK